VIYAFYAVLTVVGTALHVLIAKTPVIDTSLLYMLVVFVGVGGVMGFFVHAFRADWVAQYIGWPAGNPFQFEVACANLGKGVCGLLCIWLRDGFWLATAIAYSVFALGAAYGHIIEIKKKQNYAPGNAGGALYADILVPVVLGGLLLAKYFLQ